MHKKYQGRPHFARVGGIPETRVLFCLALQATKYMYGIFSNDVFLYDFMPLVIAWTFYCYD